ncbi:MAG: dihydroorotate dehydrogenase electron transfer subunit, partial [Oscillospiraceae bacterium]
MSYIQGACPIVTKRNLARNIFEYTLANKELAEQAFPGQFVQVRVQDFQLRRPISLADINVDRGQFKIIFEVRGAGTQQLSQSKEWDMLDIMGPLGKGFTLLPPNKKVILIGGGIGTPPLLPLSGYYGGNATTIIGFRNAQAVILDQEFVRKYNQTILCTDDGSMGKKGYVTEALKRELKNGEKPDMIYACGPTPMLKIITELAKEYHI